MQVNFMRHCQFSPGLQVQSKGILKDLFRTGKYTTFRINLSASHVFLALNAINPSIQVVGRFQVQC